MADFLLEIGLEEVPARMLAGAPEALLGAVHSLLGHNRLLERVLPVGSVNYTYSTPRRLAVRIPGVVQLQPDTVEMLTGPAWSIAFKDDEPTPAAYAFAKKVGVPVGELVPLVTPKGKYVVAGITKPGRPTMEILTESLPKTIAALNWPKPMYWRAGKPERFVRPVKWIVALLDGTVVPVEFAGVRASRESYGHRVLHGAAPVVIASPATYSDALLQAKVMVDVEARRHIIRKELDRVTRTVSGARWREDEALVDTVTHLAEWPSVVLGGFAAEYLSLPEEVLVTVMRDHQKYFAVEDKQGKLLPHFLTVLNTATDERGEAIIRHGNERVLRARFSDARFFWDFDQKTSLSDRVALLDKITFQKDLGSYRQKTERTRAIAAELAEVAQRNGAIVDKTALGHAAELAKADLTTELVKEFTELQGIVGSVYARAQGLDEKVAQAMYWQYRPASMADPVPPTIEGQLLGLADRIGTLVDLFAIGLEPSGSKDPYALRRAGNGVVKILAEGTAPLLISEVISAATGRSIGLDDSEVRTFFLQRITSFLEEVGHFNQDIVKAMPLEWGFSNGEKPISDLVARCIDVSQVRDSEDVKAISAALKRISNILLQAALQAKEEANGGSYFLNAPLSPNPVLFVEEAERNLHEAIEFATPEIFSLTYVRNYQAALARIASLRPQVDRFFDEVMVMVSDPELRANRLALLRKVSRELSSVADLSQLSPARTGSVSA